MFYELEGKHDLPRLVNAVSPQVLYSKRTADRSIGLSTESVYIRAIWSDLLLQSCEDTRPLDKSLSIL